MSYGVGPNLAGGLLMGPGVGWNNSLTVSDPLAPGDPCTNPANPGGPGGTNGPGTPGGTDGPGGPNGPGDPGGSCTADGSGSPGNNAPWSGGGPGDMPDNYGGNWGYSSPQNGWMGGNEIPLTWGGFGLPILPLTACAPPTGPVGPLPGPGGPPAGVAPPPIPTTGLTVTFLLEVGFIATTLDGLLVTCLETGETQPTNCSGQPSYSLGRSSVPDGPCATLFTPGGVADGCLGPAVHTYSSGSATAIAMGGLIINPTLRVTQLS